MINHCLVSISNDPRVVFFPIEIHQLICLKIIEPINRHVEATFTHSIINRRPIDFFLGVFLLLQLEYMLVKIELKILVGVIDAQLLEAVLCEILEPEYIEYRDRGGLFRSFVDDVINTRDQPGKQRIVQSLSEGISGV